MPKKIKKIPNVRQIKKDDQGKRKCYPIKNPRQLNDLLYYFLSKREKAKTPIKEFQAYRNYMLALTGVNTAFRTEDLTQLRVKNVEKGYMAITENKTGKTQNFRLNKVYYQEVMKYIHKYELTSSDYLFLGQMKMWNGSAYVLPITRARAYRIIKQAGDAIGIAFPFSIYSLRKTFGYMWLLAGNNGETLRQMYNHYSYVITEEYTMWGTDDAEKARAQRFLGVKAPD
ncbi:MAG: tyrosine-type recombinase/integrase [Erysipelotrichaceae bacterium]